VGTFDRLNYSDTIKKQEKAGKVRIMENKVIQSKGDLAEEYFSQGYNCSQAVLMAFTKECDIDEKTALKISSSFGGGMGRLREVCGAVTGMFMVAGLLYGYSDPKEKSLRASHYEKIQALASDFKTETNSIVCKELLGLVENSEVATKKIPCKDLVRRAATIMEEFMNTHPIREN
jgi:C_GCAxxG_C_C family probable redox protein